MAAGDERGKDLKGRGVQGSSKCVGRSGMSVINRRDPPPKVLFSLHQRRGGKKKVKLRRCDAQKVSSPA